MKTCCRFRSTLEVLAVVGAVSALSATTLAQSLNKGSTKAAQPTKKIVTKPQNLGTTTAAVDSSAAGNPKRVVAPLASTSAFAPAKNVHPVPQPPAPRGGGDGTDGCAPGSPISGSGTVATGNAGATNTPGDVEAAACGTSQTSVDVWFNYTPTATGLILFRFCAADGGSASYDTVLEAYTGCPSGGGVRITCNDDFCDGLSSQISVAATMGVPFKVRVAGFGGSTGTGVMVYSAPPPPCMLTPPPGPGTPEGEVCGTDSNGGCNSVPPIYGTITCGEVINGIAFADGGTRDTDWYNLTLPGPTTVTITGQAQFPLQIFILTSTCPPTIQGIGTAAACGIATTTFTVGGSCVIFASNSGFAGNPCGAGNDYWLQVTSCVPFGGGGPPNDACAAATPIGDGTTPFDGTGATTDGPATCGGIGSDVWFDYTASCNGVATATTCLGGVATHDTVLAVYDGTACVGTTLGCNDDGPPGCPAPAGFSGSTVSFPTTAGNHYRIQVGTFGAAPFGPSQVTMSCGGPCLLPPPAGALLEGEPCMTDTNGGCNSVPTLFQAIGCNETIAGIGWASGGTRDTDWYLVTVPASGTVSATITAEFPANLLMVSGDFVNCVGIAVDTFAQTSGCAPATATMSGLVPGTPYVVFVSPSAFDGTACMAGDIGNRYILSIDQGVSCVACCDFTNDGVINSQDFFDYLTCFFNMPLPCPGADFNGDGVVNSQDFFDFLACFFAPPAGCP